MGLDMYVDEIYKPKLDQTKYTSEQLRDLGHSFATVEDFDKYGAAMCELRPYCAKTVVTQAYYDVEKIISDYDLPENSHIGMISFDKIAVCGKRGDEYVRQEVSREEIDEKYTLVKDEECYIWHSEEVAYWRKAYETQEAWYDILEREVDNCGYYELTDEDIDLFRERFAGTDDDREFNRSRDDSALFYHEWY